MSSYDSISWLLPEKAGDLLWGNSSLRAEALCLRPSHTPCHPRSPGVQAEAASCISELQLKECNDTLKISGYYCCCLKNFSRLIPVLILWDKSPMLQSCLQPEVTLGGRFRWSHINSEGAQCAYGLGVAFLWRARSLGIIAKAGINMQGDRLTGKRLCGYTAALLTGIVSVKMVWWVCLLFLHTFWSKNW